LSPTGAPIACDFGRIDALIPSRRAVRRSIHVAGFELPADRPFGHQRRTAALAELTASAALAACTCAVATVLSIGIARANPADVVLDNQASLFAVSLLLGLFFIGAGGVSTMFFRRRSRR
jgi:hypothetical protein